MICSSFSYPNMFDVARGKISLYTDAKSITNRVKLLMLTDPTEMHMNPRFGLGLKKYMFQYNNENTIARIRDDLVEQLKLWEPAVVAESTKVTEGSSSGEEGHHLSTREAELNHLKLTVTLETAYAEMISFEIDDSEIIRDRIL